MSRDLSEISAACRGGVVTIGNFDGVHRGHARILDQLRQMAARLSCPSVVFTFDPHPLALLRPTEAPPPLTWPERKVKLIEPSGVDAVLIFRTDTALLNLTAEAFFEQLVKSALHARGMVEGPNFHFGRGRSGNVDRLREMCHAANMEFEVVEPLLHDGELISSSRIRELIQSGRVGVANQYLTQPFRIRGEVVRGAERGRTIGFPTANLAVSETIVPGHGVYAGRAMVDAISWPAAINIGPNLTFSEQSTKIEVHLAGYKGDLYGRMLEVELLDRLRPVQKFAGVAELTDQLRRDVAEVCDLCACSGFAPAD